MPSRVLRGPALSRVRRTGLGRILLLPLFFFGVLIRHFFTVPLFNLLLSRTGVCSEWAPASSRPTTISTTTIVTLATTYPLMTAPILVSTSPTVTPWIYFAAVWSR